MFLGFADSHPDPLITSTDPDAPDPDPYYICTLNFYYSDFLLSVDRYITSSCLMVPPFTNIVVFSTFYFVTLSS
jgi:hypothetical protein